MALCLANSLVARRDFVPYDQMVRYKWWYRYGYMSSTGKCFDIGEATRNSIQRFEEQQKKFSEEQAIPIEEIDYLDDPDLLRDFNVFCSEKGVAGNGALMRLAPVPLFFFRDPVKAVQYAGISGTITHGDVKAADACRLYAALIVAAVRGESKEKITKNSFYATHKIWFGSEPLHDDIRTIAEGSYKQPRGYEGGIRGKGYIVDALKAALWAFWSDEDSFEKGVLKAINLGDDTDTTAAIYGQLAGACYGYQELPKKWSKCLYGKNYIKCLSKWILVEGSIWSNNYDLDKDLVDDMELFPTEPSSSNIRRRYSVHVLHNIPSTASAHNFKSDIGSPPLVSDKHGTVSKLIDPNNSLKPMEQDASSFLAVPRSQLRRLSIPDTNTIQQRSTLLSGLNLMKKTTDRNAFNKPTDNNKF